MGSNLTTKALIEGKMFVIRGQRIILDRDLAELYKVPTKRLNEQVRRNIKRFPEDFMFRLTKAEKEKVVAICDHLKGLRFSPQLPYAFTEHGALMLANVIKSPTAIKMSIAIVRAFVKLREIAAAHTDLKRKIEAMERKYDQQFKTIFEVIRKLLEPPPKEPTRRIGFHAE